MAEDNALHGTAGRDGAQDGTQQDSQADTSRPPEQAEPEQTAPEQTAPEQTAPEQTAPRQTWAGRAASAGIVLLAAALAVVVIAETTSYPRTDDAEVFANYIGMAPVVNGPITEIRVRDNQPVHAGDVLFRIDDRPYRYTLERARSDRLALEGQIVDQGRTIRSQQSATVAAAAARRTAESNVNRAESAVEQSVADVANAQAALAHAQANYTYSLNNLHRVEPLLAKQFVTVDQVDQLRTGTEGNALAVRQAEAQVKVAEASLGSSRAALAAAQSGVLQSGAQEQQSLHAVTTLEPLTGQRGARASEIENAEYNLDHCDVRAPFDARVTNLTLSLGAFARAGVQVFTLIDTRTWWVIANFRETQLRHIQPGMHVNVTLLGSPGKLYRGVVDSTGFGVIPDASTVGTLVQGLPDVQRTLSWVHLASRYPVRIRILDPEPDALRIAESATVVVRGWEGW